MNREGFKKALSKICNVLNDRKYCWALTGGSSLFFREIINETADIDIIMTKECIVYISNSLKKYAIQEIEFMESSNIKSLFGKYEIEGVAIEFMSEVFNKSFSGNWKPHTEWINNIDIIQLNDLSVPMLSLNYEARINAELGNLDRVRIINEYLYNGSLQKTAHNH